MNDFFTYLDNFIKIGKHWYFSKKGVLKKLFLSQEMKKFNLHQLKIHQGGFNIIDLKMRNVDFQPLKHSRWPTWYLWGPPSLNLKNLK